jgi:AraC-like DNA-binding protein
MLPNDLLDNSGQVRELGVTVKPIRNDARVSGYWPAGPEVADEVGRAVDDELSQRVGGLAVIPELLSELGVDPCEVAARAGLDPGLLEAPENTISYIAMGRLFGECAAMTGCCDIGLLVGQRAGLAHLGALGQLMRYSPTLGAALRTFAAYQHLHSRGGITFLLDKDRSLVTLCYAIYEKSVEHIDQIYDGVMAMACNVLRELCGPSWAPKEILFGHARPADVGPYRRFFRAPCRFDSDQTALRFAANWLEHPIPGHDPEALRSLGEKVLARDRVELVPRLQRAIRVSLGTGISSRNEVAQILSMHRRTLSRRLRKQGTTFQRVLDEVRFAVSCQLLDATNISITEIGTSLGYAEASAFTHAFRRWSGMTPAQRRRESASPRTGV